jgi:hypothetical protein
MDLVTIVFHHEMEMKLLQLQAASLRYMDEHLIHTIYVLCHDKDPLSDRETEALVACYPPLLQSRVVILHSPTLDPRFTTTSWTTQQMIKLMVSRCVKSSYYLVLDSKNHLIRPVSASDYFDPMTSHPRLFSGKEMYMRKYYYQGLAYFGVECPFQFQGEDDDRVLQTMTPYLFRTRDVLDMLEYIETREKTSFYDFFIHRTRDHHRTTEFYLFSTFLIFSGRIHDYCITPRNFSSIMHLPPSLTLRFSDTLKNPHIKVLGLHRRVVSSWSDKEKEELIAFYHNFYDNNLFHTLLG